MPFRLCLLTLISMAEELTTKGIISSDDILLQTILRPESRVMLPSVTMSAKTGKWTKIVYGWTWSLPFKFRALFFHGFNHTRF